MYKQQFNTDIGNHKVDLTTTTKAEEDLFVTEQESIELCEEHLPSLKSSSSSLLSNGHPQQKDPSVVLPDWFDRPGATEAVEARADLCKRYSELKAGMDWLAQVGAEQIGKVESYEEASDQLKKWLSSEKAVLKDLPPLATSLPEVEKQLKEVEVRI